MASSEKNGPAQVTQYLEERCESVLQKLHKGSKPVKAIQDIICTMIQYAGGRRQRGEATATPEQFLTFIETPKTPNAKLLYDAIEGKYRIKIVIRNVRDSVTTLVTKHLARCASGAGGRLRGE